jgi:hypothetical protein
MATYMLVYIYMSHPGVADGTRIVQQQGMTQIECEKNAAQQMDTLTRAPLEARHDRLVCEKMP